MEPKAEEEDEEEETQRGGAGMIYIPKIMYVDTFLRKRVWWIPTDSRENDVSQRFRREHADTNTPTVNAPTVTKRGGGTAACRAKDR